MFNFPLAGADNQISSQNCDSNFRERSAHSVRSARRVPAHGLDNFW
jgi:hypothetical protein